MRGGDFAKAERHLDEAGLWLSPNSPAVTTQYYFKRAHLAQRRDDPEEALVHIRKAIEASERANMPERHTSSYYWNEAITLVRLHRFAEAYGPARHAMLTVSPVHADLYRIAFLGFEAYETLIIGMADLESRLAAFFGAMREKRTFAVFTLLPKELAQLCEAALERDIETAFVCDLIRSRGLKPSARQQNLSGDSIWPWAVKIRALGGFEVAIGDVPLTVTGKAQKKPLELLMALASRADQAYAGVQSLQLMDEVWPDPEAGDAKSNFDTTLHRLRKLLGVEGALLYNEGRLAFNRELVWCDAAAFRFALRELPDEPGSEVIHRCVDLYRGPLLAGQRECAWILSARERLATAFIDLVSRCGNQLENASEWRAALALYEHGLKQDNLVEAFYRGLMRAHLALGEKSEALREYRRCRDLLSVVLSIAPSSETDALKQRIQAV
jgi:DNA-binding SARP family transcriptional activator